MAADTLADVPDDTSSDAYAERLRSRSGVWWKRLLGVQAPYRWNLRRLGLGFALDVGCGIGRNLAHLDGNGVGVDHNPAAVAEARRRGLTAFTPDDFAGTEYAIPDRFDSMLLAHVVEHMPYQQAVALVQANLVFVREGGTVAFICPQEAGYRSDATHVSFTDFEVLHRLCADTGVSVARSYSFPFPRAVGRVFPYNEFVVVGRR
jgi:SAM-dependent methyltransferase